MSPKLFISYSWSSPDHQEWVLQLATELREAGIDVILDKWDLKEGQDAHVFMERMVNDADIKKVILICDKIYADKANGRSGGVGTEAQIITPELYAHHSQTKFVAVIKERSEDGSAYLPTYYKSRIYIDLSDAATYSENFERLIRWAYDQPIHKKPELGKKPAFLAEDERTIQLGTSARYKRAVDAVKNGRDFAAAAVEEYFSTLAEELEKLRITTKVDPFDEEVLKNIEGFLPYRNEAISLFVVLATYRDNDETRHVIHRFFENLFPYMERPEHITSWNEWDFDNFRFIVHELFLYAVACFLKQERFESAAYLLNTPYYQPSQAQSGREVMCPFYRTSHHMKSLAYRKERLNLNRISVHADILHQRNAGSGVEFRYLMQADFVLFLNSRIATSGWHAWWPETLVYLDHWTSPFEIFARSTSIKYFDRIKAVLGVKTKDELIAAVTAMSENPSLLPSYHYHRLNPAGLIGIEAIASKP